ncbi:MAG: hypothetical protein QXI55_05880 [Thermofilum sp.]
MPLEEDGFDAAVEVAKIAANAILEKHRGNTVTLTMKSIYRVLKACGWDALNRWRSLPFHRKVQVVDEVTAILVALGFSTVTIEKNRNRRRKIILSKALNLP